jgi:hypothetical protein
MDNLNERTTNFFFWVILAILISFFLLGAGAKISGLIISLQQIK